MRKNIILRIISLTVCTIILMSWIVPVVVNASSMTDSAKKIVLNTVEDIEKYVDDNKYPGYKEKLLALKKANPNWKFTLYYTGIDWKTALYNETKALHGRSLVQGKTGEWICEDCGNKVYDSEGWLCASEGAVAYLMDVRNYLTESYIFQFEELSYSPENYTIEGIEKVLNGTFMYNKSIREYYNNSEFEDITFAEAIMEAANASGVSPYYLAARIRQEIGVNGSDSIYGTYKGYEGYYNFYNIGATSGTTPIENGLKYASNKALGKYLLPWNDPVKAIKGGAIWIATNYIAIGQDTLYFQKYDVVSNGTTLYNHQYMQNIFAAKNEGYTTYTTYKGLGILDNNYNFIIPVYENMPTELSKVENYSSSTGSSNTSTSTSTSTSGTTSSSTSSSNTSSSTSTSSSSSKTEKVKVNVSRVNVRKSATTSSKKLTTLSKGTTVTRLAKKVAYKNGYYWDKVQLSNGKIGYIATNYLTSTTTTSSSTSTAKVNVSRVNVRKSATTSSKKLTTLSKGTKVTILSKKVAYKNGYYWDKVKLSNGTIGYIATKYLTTTK